MLEVVFLEVSISQFFRVRKILDIFQSTLIYAYVCVFAYVCVAPFIFIYSSAMGKPRAHAFAVVFVDINMTLHIYIYTCKHICIEF